MAIFASDVRYALRSFRKAPVFTAAALVSLALGIGANTAIFSLVDQLILRALPVQDAERIVLLEGRGRHYGGSTGMNSLSYPMYQDIRDRNQVFGQMMCRYRFTATVGIASDATVAIGELVSGNYFPLLGVRAARGRLFTADDDRYIGEHPLAVLGYAFWQSRLAADPGVIGQEIRVNNVPLTIVGIAQSGFDGMEPGLSTQVFVPVAMAPALRLGPGSMFDRRQRWVNVYGRLEPGMTVEKARAGLQPLFHQILDAEVMDPAFRDATAYDKSGFLRMWLDVRPGAQGNAVLRRQYEKPLWVLMGVVGLVLMIACANVAGLLTARAAARQKEIAIRLAMGSSRARTVRQLLTESLLLSVAGGIAGIGLAVAMVKALVGFLPGNIGGRYAIRDAPDLRMLGFALLLGLATGMVFGLVPALQSANPNIASTLKDLAGGVMGGRSQVRIRKALVTAQVALSLLLLIGAGLFLRSLSNLRLLNPGFRAENLVQFQVSPAAIGYSAARLHDFQEKLEERLQRIPGVSAAGLAGIAMLTGNHWDNNVLIEGYQPKTGEDVDPNFNIVSPGYFAAMGMRVLAGRPFAVRDRMGAPRVAIVNASFASRHFGDHPALGHRIGIGIDPNTPADIEIVGVVNDVRYSGLREEIPREVYLPTGQGENISTRFVYVRTERNPEQAFGAIRAAVHELDAGLPVLGMKTVSRQVDDSLATERMISTLSAAFGGLATVLAIIGLYGVMAYMVARRAREIGIRMALGAVKGNVLWIVMREVVVVLGAGIALGLPAAYYLGKLVSTELYGIDPLDMPSVASAIALLAAVALLAGYIPARRAAAYDPSRVLRYE